MEVNYYEKEAYNSRNGACLRRNLCVRFCFMSGTVDSEELSVMVTVIDIGTSVVTLPQATEKTN